MRPSRGMGCIREDKRPVKITRKDDPNEVDVYKAGGKVKKLPQVNRVIGVDRLNKAERATHKMGKQKRGQYNFGNMSKFK